jgi:hypothetical protein
MPHNCRGCASWSCWLERLVGQRNTVLFVGFVPLHVACVVWSCLLQFLVGCVRLRPPLRVMLPNAGGREGGDLWQRTVAANAFGVDYAAQLVVVVVEPTSVSCMSSLQ